MSVVWLEQAGKTALRINVAVGAQKSVVKLCSVANTAEVRVAGVWTKQLRSGRADSCGTSRCWFQKLSVSLTFSAVHSGTDSVCTFLSSGPTSGSRGACWTWTPWGAENVGLTPVGDPIGQPTGCIAGRSTPPCETNDTHEPIRMFLQANFVRFELLFVFKSAFTEPSPVCTKHI